MPSQDFTISDTLAVSGKTNVTGVIDVGSANGNVKVPFTIPNGDLVAVFGDDSLIHVGIGNPIGGECAVLNPNDYGLHVDNGSGDILIDDSGWSGTPAASVSVNPKVTVTWDVAASFRSAWVATNIILGMD